MHSAKESCRDITVKHRWTSGEESRRRGPRDVALRDGVIVVDAILAGGAVVGLGVPSRAESAPGLLCCRPR